MSRAARALRPATPGSTVRTAAFNRPGKGQGGLRRAAVNGTKWTVVQYGVSRGMTVVVFAVLSHLLLPADFGVVALANVFIAFLTIFVNGGFGQAIIQRQDLNDGHVDTVFWLNVATATVLALLLVGFAGPVSDLLGEPGLAPVLRVLSIGMVLTSLSICHNVLLRRALRFKTVAIRTLVATVVGSVAGLTLAFLGAGAWALVAQYLVFSATQTLLLWMLSGWRPGFDVSTAYLRDVFGYSNASLVNSLLTFFSARSDDFLIGAWLGAKALGFYSVGYRLLSVVSDLIGSVLTSVAFPVFARLQQDLPALRRAYLRVVRAGAAMSFPAYLIFVVIADDTTRVLFGPNWGPAVRVMQLLAVFGAIQTSLSTCDAVLNAIGRPDIVWKYRLANVAVQVGAFAVAAPFGINWVAFTLVARAYLMLPVPVYFIRREGIISFRSFLGALVAPLVASGIMIGLLQLAYTYLLGDLVPVVRLIVAGVLGAAVYLAAMLVLDRRGMVEVFTLVRSGGRGGARGGGQGRGRGGGSHRRAGGERPAAPADPVLAAGDPVVVPADPRDPSDPGDPTAPAVPLDLRKRELP